MRVSAYPSLCERLCLCHSGAHARGRLWVHLRVCICLSCVPACSPCLWLGKGTRWGRSVLKVGEAAGGLVSQPVLGASSLLRRTPSTMWHVCQQAQAKGILPSLRGGRRGRQGAGRGELSSEFWDQSLSLFLRPQNKC